MKWTWKPYIFNVLKWWESMLEEPKFSINQNAVKLLGGAGGRFIKIIWKHTWKNDIQEILKMKREIREFTHKILKSGII